MAGKKRKRGGSPNDALDVLRTTACSAQDEHRHGKLYCGCHSACEHMRLRTPSREWILGHDQDEHTQTGLRAGTMHVRAPWLRQRGRSRRAAGRGDLAGTHALRAGCHVRSGMDLRGSARFRMPPTVHVPGGECAAGLGHHDPGNLPAAIFQLELLHRLSSRRRELGAAVLRGQLPRLVASSAVPRHHHCIGGTPPTVARAARPPGRGQACIRACLHRRGPLRRRRSRWLTRTVE